MKAASESANIIDQETRAKIGRAIGRIASGVYVITLEREGKRNGILCSWVGQAAFDPPIVTVAVKNERVILSSLEPGSRFVVNVLSKKNMDVYKNFVKPWAEGMNRFQGLAVSESECGPVLSECVAFMSCAVMKQVEAGDHYLVLGQIVDAGILNADQEPMVHLRSNGFQY